MNKLPDYKGYRAFFDKETNTGYIIELGKGACSMFEYMTFAHDVCFSDIQALPMSVSEYYRNFIKIFCK